MDTNTSVHITITKDKDTKGEDRFIATNYTLGVLVASPTYTELLEGIYDELSMLYRVYTSIPEDTLTPDAVSLKNKLINIKTVTIGHIIEQSHKTPKPL